VYCDFSIAVRRVVPVDEYVRACAASSICAFRRRRVETDTLYFGGGRPRVSAASALSRLIDEIRDAFASRERRGDDRGETRRTFRRARSCLARRRREPALRSAVQSFDDDLLAWMHRTHDSAHRSRRGDRSRGKAWTISRSI
jgi:coproporphyrinogen III oxidase-like Fe-S oxidoreductase